MRVKLPFFSFLTAIGITSVLIMIAGCSPSSMNQPTTSNERFGQNNQIRFNPNNAVDIPSQEIVNQNTTISGTILEQFINDKSRLTQDVTAEESRQAPATGAPVTTPVPTQDPSATVTTPVPTQDPSATATTPVPTQDPSATATTPMPTQDPSATATTPVPTQDPSATATTPVPTQDPSATEVMNYLIDYSDVTDRPTREMAVHRNDNNVVTGFSIGDTHYSLSHQVTTTDDSVYMLPVEEGKVDLGEGLTTTLLRYGANAYTANHEIEFELIHVPTASLKAAITTDVEGNVTAETVATINGALDARFLLHFGPARSYSVTAANNTPVTDEGVTGYVTVAHAVWLDRDNDQDSFDVSADLDYTGSINVEFSEGTDTIRYSYVTPLGENSTEIRNNFIGPMPNNGSDPVAAAVQSLGEYVLNITGGDSGHARLIGRNVDVRGPNSLLLVFQLFTEETTAVTNDAGEITETTSFNPGTVIRIEGFATVTPPAPTTTE